MNPETALRIRKNANLCRVVVRLINALHQSNDPRYNEIMGRMEQAIREEAPLNVVRTPEEVYAYTTVPRKIRDYIDSNYPHLLSLANLPDKYFGHA